MWLIVPYARSFAISQALMVPILVSIIWNSGVSTVEGASQNGLKSMEIQSRHSELSVLSQVSAVEGCLLSSVPLYDLCFQ